MRNISNNVSFKIYYIPDCNIIFMLMALVFKTSYASIFTASKS